ncbi:unnamed protein product [[Candida] boidinii]|nr:unnamed protein product [[Candida] boidinii]
MSRQFRNSNWLKTNGFAPQVYLFRNIESGQVIYSQLPHVSDYQIKQQFFRPNWENRKPNKRRDLWRPMAVATFETHSKAVQAYHGLVELRYMREVSKRKEAESLRKRNEYHQIWYSSQYRPTWSQESVSDLSTIIDELKLECKVHWDTLWRKGDDKYWNEELSQHFEMDQVSPREKFVILDELRKNCLNDLAQLHSQSQSQSSETSKVEAKPIEN